MADFKEYIRYPDRVVGTTELSLDAYKAALSVKPMLYSELHINVRHKYPELINQVMNEHPGQVMYLPLVHFKLEHIKVCGTSQTGCKILSKWYHESNIWKNKFVSLLENDKPLLDVLNMYDWEASAMYFIFQGQRPNSDGIQVDTVEFSC